MERYQIVRRRENVAGFSRYARPICDLNWGVYETAYRLQRRTTVEMRKPLAEEAIDAIRARVLARMAADEAARPPEPTNIIALFIDGYGLPTAEGFAADDRTRMFEERRIL